ncbi:MAG: aspartate-semialdehyde dehydrogenase [Candidatus Tokpelaia sp. JSC161]|jgi:aspartate-semialdehyde dehydrogenase|nr:MAG: aspartate-semialdehyde dehydrogenase [Candidatus Tokpelaia sp. JSC161]
MGFKIAVADATCSVGRELLNVLRERSFPVDEVVPLAFRKSSGIEISYGDRLLKVSALDHYDFSDTDLCFLAVSDDLSKKVVPHIAQSGCTIIDHSSVWNKDPDIPLIVPEVNPEAITAFKKRNIIVNPDSSTIQLLMVLKPLHDVAQIRRVIVSTYESVSNCGDEGMNELFKQSRCVFFADPMVVSKAFSKRIAFNVIPQVDKFLENGYTSKEWRMLTEIHKILDPKIRLAATAVLVPVFIGHGEAVNVEFKNPISLAKARDILENAPGVFVLHRGYMTPYEVVAEDAVYVSRIRKDLTVNNGLAFWIVCDNLRKGAALNAIQIAELLLKRRLLFPRARRDRK